MNIPLSNGAIIISSDFKNVLSVSTYSNEAGIYVRSIESSSPAAVAGLKTGDIITAIDGVEVSSTAYLKYELYKHNVGDEVTITYKRNGEEHTTKVKLGSYDVRG